MVLPVFLFFCIVPSFGSELCLWEHLCVVHPLVKTWLGVCQLNIAFAEATILHKPLFLVLMPCLPVFLSFLITVQHENLGYWRSWIHWVSLSWQIDGKWKKWGKRVIYLLIMLYFWCSLMILLTLYRWHNLLSSYMW